MGAFRVARSASDQNDQAGMVLGLTRKSQKVIAVAADQDQSLRTSVSKDLFIGCGDWLNSHKGTKTLTGFFATFYAPGSSVFIRLPKLTLV
jgi:hypothetical protein